MTVTVKLFGMLKSLTDHQSELSVLVNGGTRVQDLVEALHSQFPSVGELLLKKKVLVSVNQDIAHWDTEISSQDEIALLPPFAGG